MKKKVLAVILGMAIVTTFMPAIAEEEAAQEQAPAQVEQVSKPTPEAPVWEPTTAPTQVPAPEEAPAETSAPEVESPVETQAPAANPTDAPVEAPEQEPFTAKVEIELENEGQIYFGDTVTLKAVVEQANADYTVAWEFYNVEADVEHGENPWVWFEKGEAYTFVVNENNAALTYRVVLNGTVISNTFNMPKVEVRPEADAETTPEPEATHPVIDEAPAPTLAPDLADSGSNEASKKDDFKSELEDEANAAPDDDEIDSEEETVVGEEPELNPDRSIVIRAEWEGAEEGEGLYIGAECTLIAELIGYDNAVYDLQWQTSQDDENWTDVEGANELTYTMTVTEENAQNFWHLIVNVTGVQAE